ncbi:uncharacterized protein LOC142328796 [Lycorma delicatula]|uniref:uncharacterized protein LOC142328796 n=1 Tax=Lycorma delicatula TaxID=130591 RepID=UPI003F50FCB3
MENNNTVDDINFVFDDIVLSENNVLQQSFEEGYQNGLKEGQLEGFHLGYHRGCELGYEIGYYKGFIRVSSSLLKKSGFQPSEKVTDALLKFKELVDKFPKHNANDSDIISMRDEIRVRYKRICSLLKIDNSLPVSDKLTY